MISHLIKIQKNTKHSNTYIAIWFHPRTSWSIAVLPLNLTNHKRSQKSGENCSSCLPTPINYTKWLKWWLKWCTEAMAHKHVNYHDVIWSPLRAGFGSDCSPPMRQWWRGIAGECMSKWTGSLSPCKCCTFQDFSIVATTIIMVKVKHPAENPSQPFLGLYYASPALAAHYRHCTRSNEPMANEHIHKHTILCSVGFGGTDWWLCTRCNTVTS